MKNNGRCFFYVLYSNKTWAFDQSEYVPGPIYMMTFGDNDLLHNLKGHLLVACRMNYVL